MTEINARNKPVGGQAHHRGRESQVFIYLGKQFRFFINENDWKVLPMAAVIAALVSMVIRKKLFFNMEGNLMGAFALTCVAIWNGCFNSIQSVCRERAIVKREHRSGMHISSYVAAHMIYQLLLCTAQTGLSMYVMQLVGVQFPAKGFITPWMIVDIGITMLLITYASDMLSLVISSLSHTTTGAMTVMPFVLIFQLVFSGGIIPLPEWSKPLSNFTISNYGIRAIAAQAGYNEVPMETAWKVLDNMRNEELGGTFTVEQLLALTESPAAGKYRDTVVLEPLTLRGAVEAAGSAVEGLSEEGQAALAALAEAGGDTQLNDTVTLGDIFDALQSSEWLQSKREDTLTLHFTLNDLFDLVGEESLKTFVQEKTAQATQKAEYARTIENIRNNWLMLGVFIVGFSLFATICLELIDKDKR